MTRDLFMESNSREMTMVFDNVPTAAFAELFKEVKKYDLDWWDVDVTTDGFGKLSYARGKFKSLAGDGAFEFQAGRLVVKVTRSAGHFSDLMIKGGLRQLVGEAVESLSLTRASEVNLSCP